MVAELNHQPLGHELPCWAELESGRGMWRGAGGASAKRRNPIWPGHLKCQVRKVLDVKKGQIWHSCEFPVHHNPRFQATRAAFPQVAKMLPRNLVQSSRWSVHAPYEQRAPSKVSCSIVAYP